MGLRRPVAKGSGDGPLAEAQPLQPALGAGVACLSREESKAQRKLAFEDSRIDL